MHAFYRTTGGEDISHQAEVQMLKDAGHQVWDHTKYNADFARRSKLGQFAGTVYNLEARAHMVSLLNEFHPDIIYVNNTFPSFSASIVNAAAESGIPFVQVVRNYRRGCIAGTLYRDGAPCSVCITRPLGLPGIVHKCYNHSLGASLAATASRLTHRVVSSTGHPSHFVAVSRFVGDTLVENGIPASAITVRPNLVRPAEVRISPGPRSNFLFIGRDTPEKGLQWLVDEFHRVDDGQMRLDVVGVDAPEKTSQSSDRLVYHGKVKHAQAIRMMGNALRVVVPSVWPEPFGRVAVEALSVGTAVIASRVGGMSDFAGEAVTLVEPTEPEQLGQALSAAVSSLETENLAEVSRSRYERDFSPKKWLSITEALFSRLIDEGR